MPSNVEVVQSLYAAFEAQDIPAVLDLVAEDVRWAVNCADPEGVPWFGEFNGKDTLPGFFEGLAAVEFTDFTLRAIAADGDVVMAWFHVAFTTQDGAKVDMSEAHVWEVRDGLIQSAVLHEDSHAVKAAFGR